MPRFCKICMEEFPTASKLLEHLKFSTCGNSRSAVKCPYCNRDDFLDEDSLNRHLSYNRCCSKADVEATDKLSILRHDPGNSSFHTSSSGKPAHQSYADVVHHHEGNLVNIANAIEMYAIYQRQTALNPSDMKEQQIVVTLTHNSSGIDKTADEKTILVIDKTLLFNLQEGKIQLDNLNKDDQYLLPEKSSMSNVQDGKVRPDNLTIVDLDDVAAPDGLDTAVAGDEYHADNRTHEEQTSDVDDMTAEGDTMAFNVEADDEYEGAEDEDEPEDFNADANEGYNGAADDNHGQGLQYDQQSSSVHVFHGGSKELDCLAELYSMLDKRGVANSLFDQITNWAWINASIFGRTPPMKRDVVVHKVFEQVRGPNYKDVMSPKQEILQLSTGRHVAISYFPIENMIKDLLHNSTLMAKENLIFSDYNDLSQRGPYNSTFGDVDTGCWWDNAQRHECKEDNDVLWPLIMFIDGMKVDNLAGKLKLEPISFTFSRFHRWVRHQDNAWRTWAYMEEVKQPIANGQEGPALTPQEKLQEYHDILGFLMKDLKRIQEHGLPWVLDFGGGCVHKVNLKMPLQFIIGDCEGHDKLVGRFKGHTMNIKGLCRDCDVPTQHADDEHWQCTYFNDNEMQHLSQEELRLYSFHEIRSGFNGVSVGGSSRGIREALNPEILHLYSSGHCDWVSDGYLHSLSTTSTQMTNKASAFLVTMYRGQSDRSFPNIGTFRDGLTSHQGVNLKAHEKHARLFFIYLLLSCSDYVSMLDSHHKRGSEYNLAFYRRFVGMLEHSLGFYEWSQKREHSKDSVLGYDGTPETSKAQDSARRYMHLLKTCCPRGDLGKSFKMVKFHQTLHMVDAITRHGSLLNIDTGRPESMAKGNVKDPASHTQGVSSTLSYQTGKRYMESLTFREYKRMKAEQNGNSPVDCGVGSYLNMNTKEACLFRKTMLSQVSDNSNNERDITVIPRGTRFKIILDVDRRDGEFPVTLEWKCRGKKPLVAFDDGLLQQLGRRLFGSDDGGVVIDDEVTGFTAVKCDEVLYNAHPLFKNAHPWHDWVYVKWEGYDDPIPARIEMFFDLRCVDISNEDINNRNDSDSESSVNRVPTYFNHMFLENKIYAIIWSAKSLEISRAKITDHHLPLNLAYRVEMEEHRRIVAVESFVKPCYGFLNSSGLAMAFDYTAVIMRGRETWADYYMS